MIDSNDTVLREKDITYALGGAVPNTYELLLARRVWDRAYQSGIWHGIDLAAHEIATAMAAANEKAARPK